MSKAFELFAKNMRHFRKLKKMSQVKLAEASGCLGPQISNYETSKGSIPNLETIEAIATALGITPSDLLFDYSQNVFLSEAIRALDALDPDRNIPSVQGARALLTGDKSVIKQRADEVRESMRNSSKKA